MKKVKRAAAGLAAASLCLSLTACGGTNGGDAQSTAAKTPGEIVAASQEKLMGVKSYHISMDMDISMDLTVSDQTQTVDTVTTTDLLLFQNPLKMKGTMTMDMGDLGTQELTYYGQEADGKQTVYTQAGDQWVKQELDMEQMGSYDPRQSLALYLDSASAFTDAGKDTVSGAEASKYTGVIAGDQMQKVMEESGILDSVDAMTGTGIDEAQLKEILSGFEDIPMSVWINAEGYPVQYEMDMGEMMNALMSKLLDAAGAAEQGVSIAVSKAAVQMTCDQFDAVSDFEIPAEALNAA